MCACASSHCGALQHRIASIIHLPLGHVTSVVTPEQRYLPQMFEYGKPPSWWKLDKWNDGQFDRTISILQGIYGRAQKPWQDMQKALR